MKNQSTISPWAKILAPLFATILLGNAQVQAQPGATPPGTVPPGQPAPAPAPAPEPPPPDQAPTPDYGPAPTPDYGPAPVYSQPAPTPYAPPSQPPQVETPTRRYGWNAGISLGFGSLKSDDGQFQCRNCEAAPPAFAFDLRMGIMVSHNLSLQAEYWIQARAVDESANQTLGQALFMLSGQYWLSPRFWFRGGIGSAYLQLQNNNGDGVELATGTALMGGIGYEIAHSTHYSFDIELKYGIGIYDENQVGQVNSSALNLGLNWY